MAANNEIPRGTPAFTTGGGGFAFEDRAGMWLVAAMIAGQSPLTSLGVPTVVAFQQKVPPTALDDVIVAGPGENTTPRWLASIKSFDLLGSASSLAEFVEGAWVQYLADEFDRARDRVGFICGQVSGESWTSLLELIETVRNDTPERMAARIVVPGLFNDTDRRLWEAFKCPEELAAAYDVDIASSPSVLLQCLVPLHLDFRSAASGSEAQAKQWCETALAPGHRDRAEELYNAVFELVSQVRPSGGSIDWAHVQRTFGVRFPLALRPDAGPDWALLDLHTQERLDGVKDTMANGLRLPRREAREHLSAADAAACAYLTGPSGCGKTALAKSWLEATNASRLWLNPPDISEGLLALRNRLRLRLPLDDVIALGQAPVRIVIDGLDRSYDQGAFAAAAALTRLAERSNSSIQVMITSQEWALERVAQLVAAANGSDATTVVIGDLDEDDTRIALDERPAIQRVAFQGRLQQVLKRPKMLQVVFQALDAANDHALAGVRDEADVADLWWSRLALGTAPDRAARVEFLRGLATWTARELVEALPAGDLRSAGLSDYIGVVDSLRTEEVLAVAESSYAFGHDLFADWTRYKSLGHWDVAEATISQYEGVPPWHRAIRLYALRALREGGIELWTEQHRALREAGHEVAADLYLDAPMFSADAEAQIEALWPTLLADGGRLLARMLNRFAHSASVPDPRGALVAAGGDPEIQTYFAATWRIPIWVLWPAVIRVLARHTSEAIRAAPFQVALVVDRWLRLTPRDYPGRAEAAALGFAAGEFVESAHDNGIYFDEDDKLKLWDAFLAAAAALPQEVTTFALEVLRPIGGEEIEDL